MSPLLPDKRACFLITVDKRRLSITAASGLLAAYLLLAVQQLEKPLLQIHLHCVPKKVDHQTHAGNFVKFEWIFKVHSSLKREFTTKPV